MTLHLARSDIRFLQSIFNIYKFFGVVPSYDFDKERITRSALNKVQAFTYSTLIFSGGTYCFYMRRTQLSRFYGMPEMVLDCLYDVVLHLLTISMILSSCLFNQKQWAKLMNAFQQIDRQLNTRNSKVKRFIEIPLLQMVLCNLMLMACFGFYYYTWFATVEINCYYLMDQICSYYHCLITFLMYNLERAFQSRYKKINQVLKETIRSSCFKMGQKIGNDLTTTTTSVVNTCSLREIECLLRKMNEMVEIHNEIFGWALVGCFGLSVIDILISLDMNMADSAIWHADNVATLSSAFMALFLLVSTSMVVMSCDFASRESKKTTSLCYKLQEHLPAQSPERRELLLLAKIAAHNVARFTAADFFELNRNALCCILGTTTTYLIVMIQFNHNSVKE